MINWLDIVNTLIAIASAVIAFLTFKNTDSIKNTIAVEISQEQFIASRDELKKHLKKCKSIILKGDVRPANDSGFTTSITFILSSLERFFSKNSNSKDYTKLLNIKNQLESLLSAHVVDDDTMDIIQNTGIYGTLLGYLEELIENGRVTG